MSIEAGWAQWTILLGPLVIGLVWTLRQLLGTLFRHHDLQSFIGRWPRGMDEAAIEQAVGGVLARMSLREKIDQLSGDGGLAVLVKLGIYVFGLKRFPSIYAGHNARLGIPPLSFTDGPRGVVIGHATCFPVAMLRGASWDPALEVRVGEAIGKEAGASGANYFAGLCVNLLRHPAWGRAQETYGEDSWHLGTMALGLMRGVQSQHVMVCAKHFAANSIENSRFYVDVKIDPRTLHDVYLPHFRRLVEGGVDSLMSAYNKLNGEYCGHSRHLLTEILRKQWRFRGFVSSDWLWGIYDTKAAMHAGMDVEMPYARYYGRHLRNAVWRRQVPVEQIDESVRRVLRAKIRWISHLPEGVPGRDVIACDAHRLLAREVAEQSMVLLSNNGILPWQPDALAGKIIAVVGELADQPCLGDHGSSRVSPPTCITFLQGIREYAGEGITVLYHDGQDAVAAAKLAVGADVVLLVAGYQAEDEGENLTSNRKPQKNPEPPRGGDRMSLALPDDQCRLIELVCAANKSTVLALVSGSAVMLDDVSHLPAALLFAGYPGMEGGHALARILFGAVNPSGKLPFTMPSRQQALPPFDCWAEHVEYSGLHGYTLADRMGVIPAFSFGFGLSYTCFECSAPKLIESTISSDSVLQCDVRIRNTGVRAGAEVVQVYIGPAHAEQTHGMQQALPLRRLQAFSKVWLEPGAELHLSFSIPLSDLVMYDVGEQNMQVQPGEYKLWVGTSSREDDLQDAIFRIEA
jgi:beta-glucosidase